MVVMYSVAVAALVSISTDLGEGRLRPRQQNKRTKQEQLSSTRAMARYVANVGCT